MIVLFRWHQINYRVVEQSTIGEITCSVISESAADIRNPNATLFSWIPDLSFASSGMKIIVYSELVEQYPYTYLSVPGLLQCIELTRLNQVLLVHLVPENLVFRARSELNGFAGKDCELFWSTGVLED